jgi:hypothetical protein
MAMFMTNYTSRNLNAIELLLPVILLTPHENECYLQKRIFEFTGGLHIGHQAVLNIQ